MTDQNRILLEDGGHLLAEARLSDVDPEGRVQAQVHVEPGDLPPGTRHTMADKVHDHLLTHDARHLHAAVPLGDCELIEGMTGHLSDVTLRAAGASSLIDGDVLRP